VGRKTHLRGDGAVIFTRRDAFPRQALRLTVNAAAALVLALTPGAYAAAGQGTRGVTSAGAVEDAMDRLYTRAVEAAQAGRADEAAALFDELLGAMPGGHPLRALALYGAGRANERRGTVAAACVAAERYKVFIGLPDAEPEKRERAANVLGALSVRCAGAVPALASAPSPSPAGAVTQALAPAGPPADHTWAWVTAGGAVLGLAGGAFLLAEADVAVDEGDAAYARFVSSGRTSVPARDAVLSANDRVETFGTAGHATLGVGAVLGGLAIWLWLRSPEDGTAPSALRMGQTGAIWGGRF